MYAGLSPDSDKAVRLNQQYSFSKQCEITKILWKNKSITSQF